MKLRADGEVRESHFQSEVKRALESQGAEVLNLHGHAMQAAGWPDLYVAHWAWEGWLELKSGAEKLTSAQAHKLKVLDQRQVAAFVLRASRGGVRVEDWSGFVEDVGPLGLCEMTGAKLIALLAKATVKRAKRRAKPQDRAAQKLEKRNGLWPDEQAEPFTL